MDLEVLKERIENLDPVLHRSLRSALITEYNRRLSGQAPAERPQPHGRVDPFEDLYRKAADDIAEHYVQGTDDFIRQYHPGLYRTTEELGSRIDELWIAGRRGEATIGEFQQVLNQWCQTYLKAIELYSKARAEETQSRKPEDGQGQGHD